MINYFLPNIKLFETKQNSENMYTIGFLTNMNIEYWAFGTIFVLEWFSFPLEHFQTTVNNLKTHFWNLCFFVNLVSSAVITMMYKWKKFFNQIDALLKGYILKRKGIWFVNYCCNSWQNFDLQNYGKPI